MPIQASEPVAERPAADTGWRVPAARAREQWLSDPRRTPRREWTGWAVMQRSTVRPKVD